MSVLVLAFPVKLRRVADALDLVLCCGFCGRFWRINGNATGTSGPSSEADPVSNTLDPVATTLAPVMPIQTASSFSTAQIPTPTAQKGDASTIFCSECGAGTDGRFCPECGCAVAG